MKSLEYRSDNKEEINNYINNPHVLFKNGNCAYCIILNDMVGDSIFSGGISMILGYTYADGLYGSQIQIKYSYEGVRKRNKANGEWGDIIQIQGN